MTHHCMTSSSPSSGTRMQTAATASAIGRAAAAVEPPTIDSMEFVDMLRAINRVKTNSDVKSFTEAAERFVRV